MGFEHCDINCEPVACRGAEVPLAIDADVAEGLRKLAAREHTTLFVVLQAALKVCTCRVSEQGRGLCWTSSGPQRRARMGVTAAALPDGYFMSCRYC